MPNIMTHALCANDILQEFQDNQVYQSIQEYPRAYSTASSGPDFLFYYKAYPFQDVEAARVVHQIGEDVHRRLINDFYIKAIDIIKNENKEETKHLMVSFIAGHLTHWALDSVAHPFVFHRSGELKGKTQFWHFRFESMLDTLMVKQVKKLRLDKNPSNLMVTLNRSEIDVCAELYADIVNHVYETQHPVEVFKQSFKDMALISKWLFDPHTRLFPLVQIIEKRLKVDWKYSSHMIIGELDQDHDVLNLSHSPWSHPSDELSLSNESFLDLYERAIERGRVVLQALNDVLFENKPIELILDILKNQSYDTGYSVAKPMYNYQSIYERDHEAV